MKHSLARSSRRVSKCFRFGGMLLCTTLFINLNLWASNTACSKGKSGVVGCIGTYHLCGDGSLSKSKRICQSPHQTILKHIDPSPMKDGDNCRCRLGRFCIGPRSGLYCLDNLNQRSYI